MKKFWIYLAALAVSFTACQSNEPFDTQDENDAPLILKPYSEALTGSFIYWLTDENTPLVDSVVVTPSNYTTVNWYVNGVLVHTGTKINQTFPQGTHDLLIEAVTTKGKRTTRTGLIMVKPHVLWEGPHNIAWDESIKVSKAQMADVPAGARIIVFFSALESQEYYAMRVTTPWWGDNPEKDDLVPQMNEIKDMPSPFIFTYDEHCKALVDERGAFMVVGNGFKINNIITDK